MGPCLEPHPWPGDLGRAGHSASAWSPSLLPHEAVHRTQRWEAGRGWAPGRYLAAGLYLPWRYRPPHPSAFDSKWCWARTVCLDAILQKGPGLLWVAVLVLLLWESPGKRSLRAAGVQSGGSSTTPRWAFPWPPSPPACLPPRWAEHSCRGRETKVGALAA